MPSVTTGTLLVADDIVLIGTNGIALGSEHSTIVAAERGKYRSRRALDGRPNSDLNR